MVSLVGTENYCENSVNCKDPDAGKIEGRRRRIDGG